MRRYVWRGPTDPRGVNWLKIGAVGHSTLTRWIARNRDRQIDAPEKGRSEDMTAELKRLRRENEILRQEHDSLKKATAFFAREKSR
jgi:transposase